MSDIYRHAIRFADLWAVDHHRMVDEIYAPTIHMESMCALDHQPVTSGADLHVLEDRLDGLIPQHRHELVRVTAQRTHACLETTVVSPTTGEYAPACVWWWMDANGQVDDEVGFFDWSRRSADCRVSHGFVPPSDKASHAPSAALLDALRAGNLAAHIAPGCVVEAVGVGPCGLPSEPLDVLASVEEGTVVAALVVGHVGSAVWRATAVMSAGPGAGLVSVRWYGYPAAPVERDAVHPAMNLERRHAREQ